MDDDAPIDYETIQGRFPWVGCMASDETHDFSARYRHIMADSHRNRDIVEMLTEVLQRDSDQGCQDGCASRAVLEELRAELEKAEAVYPDER